MLRLPTACCEPGRLLMTAGEPAHAQICVAAW